MDKHNDRRTPNFFKIGLSLTASMALMIDCYALAKNLSIEALLFYSLPLIVLVLIGLYISYVAYKRLNDTLDLPTSSVMMSYGITTIGCGIILLRSFVYFNVSYGYILLPLAIDFVGAAILVSVVSIVKSRAGDHLKLCLLLLFTTLAIAGVVLTR